MSEASEKLKGVLRHLDKYCESTTLQCGCYDGALEVEADDLRALLAERTEMIDAMRWTIRGYRAGVTPDVMADFIEEMATLTGDPDFPLPPPPEAPQPQELPPPRLPPREEP